jgi:hypothetical protein
MKQRQLYALRQKLKNGKTKNPHALKNKIAQIESQLIIEANKRRWYQFLAQ